MSELVELLYEVFNRLVIGVCQSYVFDRLNCIWVLSVEWLGGLLLCIFQHLLDECLRAEILWEAKYSRRDGWQGYTL